VAHKSALSLAPSVQIIISITKQRVARIQSLPAMHGALYGAPNIAM